MDEFNPEQRVVVEVLRVVGNPDPESVVRAAPLAAAHIGSYLAPAMEKLCQQMAAAAPAIHRLTEALEQARRDARRELRRRAAGWLAWFVVSTVLWMTIGLAILWAT